MGYAIKNFRIRFYGIQGSGSTFPAKHETEALHELTECELLEKVFQDIAGRMDDDNRLDTTLTDYLGGPVNRKTLRQYRKRFDVPSPRIYGGWTTCVHIETADGYDIVLDCGSGFRNCAKDLQSKWGDSPKRDLYIFGSHSHFDHTEGFDQAAVCFDPRNRLHILANYQYLHSLNSYLGIFSRFVPEDVLGLQTPINFSNMPAKFRGTELRDMADPVLTAQKKPEHWDLHDIRQTIRLGKTEITPFRVYHPAPCLAYKIQRNGKTFIYCTDHERRHGKDPEHAGQLESEAAEARLVHHARDADVMYRDGQYLRSEYDGLTGIGSSTPVSRIDWGHSCIEDVEEMALNCRVRHTYIGHHDPNREWSEKNWIDEALSRSSKNREEKIELAQAGTIIDL